MSSVDFMSVHNSNSLETIKNSNSQLSPIVIENNFLLYNDQSLYLGHFNLDSLSKDKEFEEYVSLLGVEEFVDIIRPQVFLVNKLASQDYTIIDDYYECLMNNTYDEKKINVFHSLMNDLFKVYDFLVPQITEIVNDYKMTMHKIEMMENTEGFLDNEIEYYHSIQDNGLIFSSKLQNAKSLVRKLEMDNPGSKAGYISALFTSVIITVAGIALAIIMNLK